MKDNEKKVKLTEEEAKKEVQPEEKGAKLTDEELAQVVGGSVRAAAAEDVIETSVR